MVSTQRKPKRLKVKAGLMKNHIVSGSGIDILIDDFIGVRTILSATILSIPFCLYYFVHTILSVPFCLLPFCPYHFVRTILSIPFCLYHFVCYHFVIEP